MKKRRQFSDEYKAEVVELIVNEGRGISKVCQELELTESAVRNWVKQAQISSGNATPGVLKKDDLDELKRLRQEVKQLRMERDI